MSWTDAEQDEHRAAFIKECRRKAWGAACEADFIGKQADKLMAEYARFSEDRDALAASPDGHTVANREKRKQLVDGMKLIQESIAKGQERMQSLLVQSDNNLAVAKHAEGWSTPDTAAEEV